MRRLPVLALACALLALPAAAGARVVAIASGDGTLTLADVSSNKVINRVSVGGGATAVAIAPDGARAYTASGPRISVVDLATQKVTGTANAGGAIRGPALSADGARLYAARRGGVDVVDTSNLQPAGMVPLGTAPTGRIAVSADGTRAVVVLDRTHVEVLDLTRFAPLKKLEVSAPADVAFGAALTAYVSTERGKLAVVGTPTGRLLRNVNVGKGVGGGRGVSAGQTRAFVGALACSKSITPVDPKAPRT